MDIKRILVPTDFSEFSNYAVDHALYWAEIFQAEVTLFHAMTLQIGDLTDESALNRFTEQVKAREESVFSQLGQKDADGTKRGVKIRKFMERGIDPADTILSYVEQNEFDLVMMGSQGKSGLQRWMFGSVAEKVLRRCPIPVMTIRQPLEKMAIKKILVPIDFSETSKHTLEAASNLAHTFDASLLVLHIVEQHIYPAFYEEKMDSASDPNFRVEQLALQKLEELLPASSPEATCVVVRGAAYHQIIEQVSEHSADLIMMATRGLTGIEHLLLGSTTERVVRFATVPVLTVGEKT